MRGFQRFRGLIQALMPPRRRSFADFRARRPSFSITVSRFEILPSRDTRFEFGGIAASRSAVGHYAFMPPGHSDFWLFHGWLAPAAQRR